MDRPKLEVADIFRRYGEAYREQHGSSMSSAQRRVMTAIEVCRTAALGGHLERCDCCSHERPCYDSCGERHCPKCQFLARAEWVEKRTSEVLDTHYFHVVFTIPEPVAAIAHQNKVLLYDILFRATAETLSTIAADPQHLGAEIGFFAVLHSWGQNLFLHPHVHCVIPVGGLSLDGQHWVRPRYTFFLPANLLSGVFRGKFIAGLKRAFQKQQLSFPGSIRHLADEKAFRSFLRSLFRHDWVVYAKRPFGGPQHVLHYRALEDYRNAYATSISAVAAHLHIRLIHFFVYQAHVR